MSVTEPNHSKLTLLIKILLGFAVAFVIWTAIKTFKVNGSDVALAFLLASLSLVLVCAGLLFKSNALQCLIASVGIALVVGGVLKFPPWEAGPHDPKIEHSFTAAGYAVTLANDNGCVWINAEKGQTYVCDVIVEKLGPKQPVEPAKAESTEAASASPAVAEQAPTKG